MAVEVKGTAEMTNQAAKGLALFEKEKANDDIEVDMEAATTYKSEVDSQISELNEMIKTLSGKDNKKLRTEKSKEAAALANTDEYIDACKVVKGQTPKHGHFVKNFGMRETKSAPAPETAPKAEAPVEPEKEKKAAAEKEKKAPKKVESAGISKAERDELEKLKAQIIDLKASLKMEGMTGGQINKDERVVTMVTRMNELKEKESPGSTSNKKDDKADGKKAKKALSADQEASVKKLEQEIEALRHKLQTECGFNKKEIQKDPDMIDLQAELDKLTGKK